MKRTYLQLFIVILLSASAIHSQNQSVQYLKSNLEFLASDELEGREATTRGEKIASLFIAQELNKYGVKPFGDSGSFFQNFNMAVISADNEKTSLVIIENDGTKKTVSFNKDFVLSKSPLPNDRYSGKSYKIVFAGYGIESEEENYSDYENLDVKGKLVVVLPGSPLESQKNIFITKLGDLKRKSAEKHGAAGIISLLDKKKSAFWSMIAGYYSSPIFKLESELNDLDSVSIPSFVLSYETGKLIFENEKLTFDKIENLFDQDTIIRNYFEFNKEFEINFAFKKNLKPARNVIGVLEGSDENFKKEFVTIGAHYDHLGIKGENIYNGADDNGSGTASVLELARLMASEKMNKRSILFVFHTAEEKGLKGAKYLVNNSDHIIKNAVVNINIDMVGRESIDTIFNVGSGRLSSELYDLVREVNSQTVNFVLDYKFDDPNDPKDIYNRSDHKQYADKGIPVVFFFDEMNVDYHKPTDTFEKINYDKILKVVELSKALLLRIANLDHKLKVDKLETKKEQMEEAN